jgi:hypothetical protein
MENESKDLEQNLNLVIEDLVDGLYSLAEKARDGASRDELADIIEQMAGIICKHWPDCFDRMEKESAC